jgi:hypothetical protein
MLAKYILLTLSLGFLIAALVRGPRSAQGRIWLTIAVIFTVVSLWLFSRT